MDATADDRTVLRPDRPPIAGESECRVEIAEDLPDEGHAHQAVCTRLSYGTNPPTSGAHWPLWARYGRYNDPVPREMLVHNLEHGAVVMAVRCGPECPEVLAAFLDAAAVLPDDPLCTALGPGAPAHRLVITPDPLLDAPLALSAWRASYVATCVDPESLGAFLRAHYGRGPEALCNEGSDPANPATGVPACPR